MSKLVNALIELTDENTKLNNAIREIPPEYLEMDVYELEKEVTPTKVERVLKIKMHDEINNAMMNGKVITKAGLCKGACHVNHFDRNIISKPKLLAWLLTPDITSQLELKMLGSKSIKRLEEIVSMPIGNDTKKAELVMKAAKMILDRTDPITTKQEVKQMQLKADLSKDISEDKKLETIRKLQKQLGYTPDEEN